MSPSCVPLHVTCDGTLAAWYSVARQSRWHSAPSESGELSSSELPAAVLPLLMALSCSGRWRSVPEVPVACKEGLEGEGGACGPSVAPSFPTCGSSRGLTDQHSIVCEKGPLLPFSRGSRGRSCCQPRRLPCFWNRAKMRGVGGTALNRRWRGGNPS